MSKRAIEWAFERKLGPGAEGYVLLALAHLADDEGSCWPSSASLRRMTTSNEPAKAASSLEWALESLENRGLIKKTARHGEHGEPLLSSYRICLDTREERP